MRECVPIRTLSRTESLLKIARFWKVRPIPASTIRCAGRLRIDFPWKIMSPESGLQSRLRQLNNVVFPAPFGPIRPKTVPGFIEAYAVERNDTSELNADVADFQNLVLQAMRRRLSLLGASFCSKR
jgi:hypothetical protein